MQRRCHVQCEQTDAAYSCRSAMAFGPMGPRFCKRILRGTQKAVRQQTSGSACSVPALRFVPDRLPRVGCCWVETGYRRSERKFEAARSGQHLGSIRPIHPSTDLQQYAPEAVSRARSDLMRAALRSLLSSALRMVPGAAGTP